MRKKALWLSRHPILPEQERFLKSKGYDVIYSSEWAEKNYRVRRVQDLLRMVNRENPDIVIPSIPVSMLNDFLEVCKIPIIQAVMRPMKHTPTETEYTWTGKWRKLVKAELKYDEWP